MGKHDVIHKPEVDNLLYSRRGEESEPRLQVTCTENFVKFGRLGFLRCTDEIQPRDASEI